MDDQPSVTAYKVPAGGWRPAKSLGSILAREITTKRVGPDLFAEHTAIELEGWVGHDLEAVGRLTHPMRSLASGRASLEAFYMHALFARNAEGADIPAAKSIPVSAHELPLLPVDATPDCPRQAAVR